MSNITLQWRYNDHDGISNHQPHGCLLNRLFRRRSKKTSKLPVTGLCAGNSPVPGEFPAQMASNAENVSIWWRHHDQPHGYYSIPHRVWFCFALFLLWLNYHSSVVDLSISFMESYDSLSSSLPGQMSTISQTIFSDAFLCKKRFVLWLKFTEVCF